MCEKDPKQRQKFGGLTLLEDEMPKFKGRGGRSPRFCLSLYLVSQQSRNTGFRGITNGGQVVASFEGQDDATPGQAHQLLRQVPEACKEGKEEMQEKGKVCGWNQAPGEGSKNYRKELHHIKKPQRDLKGLNA